MRLLLAMTGRQLELKSKEEEKEEEEEETFCIEGPREWSRGEEHEGGG